MDVKYISDLHWYDAYSDEWRKDTGLSVIDFVEMSVYEWNAVCSSDDIIVVAGDIGKPCGRTVNALLAVKGTKILVRGNHDCKWSTWDLRKVFTHVVPVLQVGNVLVNHTPDIQMPDDFYLVHGHHHIYSTDSMTKERIKYLRDPMRFNCCTDLNAYRPSTFLQLRINKERIREITNT